MTHARTPDVILDTVSRSFEGQPVVCIGTGPSLTKDDVASVKGQAKVIAINDAYAWAPGADVLYAADAAWWQTHKDALAFAGEKYTVVSPAKIADGVQFQGVKRLRHAGYRGLSLQPDRLCLGLAGGSNSGYQAINLAVLMGASRILLLGYDMQRDANRRNHFFGKHPDGLSNASPYELMARAFNDLVEPLKHLGIPIVNCTRETALTAFPRQPLHETLAQQVAA
jgi:hypothetical protein